MKKIIIGIILIALIFGFTSLVLSSLVISPACHVIGEITKVEFVEAYNDSCLKNPPCPTDTETMFPDRYRLDVRVIDTYLDENYTRTTPESCQEVYSINQVSEIWISKSLVKSGDRLESGKIIETTVWYHDFYEYNLTENNPSKCHDFYWFDNENKECLQKEFCGAYMYPGLKVFEDKELCEKDAKKSREQDYCLNWTAQKGIIPVSSIGYFEVKDDKCKWIPRGSIHTGCEDEEESYFQKCCDELAEEMKIIKPLCMGRWINNTEYNWQCARECCSKQNYSENWCKYGELIKEYDKDNCVIEKCIFSSVDGRKSEIKIMPQTASQTAIARLGDLGFEIRLKEVGSGNNKRIVYELTGNKQGKFLGIFKIMASEKVQVDAETGEVKKIIKPWWAFLASGV